MGSSPIRVAIFGSVAELVEQRTENPRVTGSIPVGATISAGLAHLVERHLAKVEVASSSLVTRSRKAVLHLQGGFCHIFERRGLILAGADGRIKNRLARSVRTNGIGGQRYENLFVRY